MHPDLSAAGPRHVPVRQRFRRTILSQAVLCAGWAAALGSTASFAQAQAPMHQAHAVARHDIPSGRLDQALNRFAVSAGILLAIDAALTAGKTSAGLSGSYGVREGLSALLQGSGLEAVAQPGGDYALRASTTAPGAAGSSAPVEHAPLQTIQVMGQRDTNGGYRKQEASGASKISAPLRDLPVSVQVVPRKVIDDQGAFRTEDIVQNASGVNIGAPSSRSGDNLIFRGFSTSEFLRDGMPDRRRSMRDTSNIEQIEVLKGPASVLYGRIEPGGTLNYITKRPLFVPRYEASLRVDSYGLVRPTVDLSTVSEGGTLGLRLNAALEHGGTYRDDSFSDRQFLAGAVGWRPSSRTQVSAEFELLEDHRSNGDDMGLPFYRGAPAPIPLSRLLSEPEHYRDTSDRLFGYTVDHQIDAEWKLRHALRHVTQTTQLIKDNLNSRSVSTEYISNVDPVTGRIGRNFAEQQTDRETLTAQFEVSGDIRLQAMRHQVLLGAETDRIASTDNNGSASAGVAANELDIFNPVYGQLSRQGLRQTTLSDSAIRAKALYLQDLVDLAPQWKLLLGARYDQARNRNANRLNGSLAGADSSALSPRAGIVWQPSPVLAVYGSYSEAFAPVVGQDFFGKLFKPTIGEQLELGVKSDWFDGKLSLSAAVFRITKTNISAADPEHNGFNIQTGEITSDGVEFDVVGSPLPRLGVIANLSLTDVRITQETRANLIGVRPSNTARANARLWVNYDFQGESWRNWSAGAGGTYVGDRVNSNSQRDFHTVPSYVRWDATLAYRARDWRFAFKLENLFDKRYYVSSNNLVLSPGNPRNLALTASYRF